VGRAIALPEAWIDLNVPCVLDYQSAKHHAKHNHSIASSSSATKVRLPAHPQAPTHSSKLGCAHEFLHKSTHMQCLPIASPLTRLSHNGLQTRATFTRNPSILPPSQSCSTISKPTIPASPSANFKSRTSMPGSLKLKSKWNRRLRSWPYGISSLPASSS
jgi:hypothetical protein